MRHGFDPWVGKIPWSRKWQAIPVFFLGKFHGQRSLAGCSPWGHKELDMTEHSTAQHKRGHNIENYILQPLFYVDEAWGKKWEWK